MELLAHIHHREGQVVPAKSTTLSQIIRAFQRYFYQILCSHMSIASEKGSTNSLKKSRSNQDSMGKAFILDE